MSNKILKKAEELARLAYPGPENPLYAMSRACPSDSVERYNRMVAYSQVLAAQVVFISLHEKEGEGLAPFHKELMTRLASDFDRTDPIFSGKLVAGVFESAKAIAGQHFVDMRLSLTEQQKIKTAIDLFKAHYHEEYASPAENPASIAHAQIAETFETVVASRAQAAAAQLPQKKNKGPSMTLEMA